MSAFLYLVGKTMIITSTSIFTFLFMLPELMIAFENKEEEIIPHIPKKKNN